MCHCLLQWQLDVLPFVPAVSHLTFTTEPNTVHGHYGFPPYEKGRKPCKPATCKAAADWSYPLVDVSGGLISSWRGASRLGWCMPLPAGRLVPQAPARVGSLQLQLEVCTIYNPPPPGLA